MNVSKSSFKLTVANIAGTVITFVAITIFSRSLGPKIIGVYFLFEALVSILVIPADFGIREAMEKHISEGYDEQELLSAGIIYKIGVLFFLSLLVVVFRSPINGYLGEDLAFLLIIALATKELALTTTTILKA
ncbi:MAG: oligosaccharide flippase family protein, partial [Halobacteriaceae archaeon]